MFPQLLLLLTYLINPTVSDTCECRSANFGTDVRGGELKSPGYPVQYCVNLDCKYEIDGVPGKAIHLSIVSFETELRHDYLEIHQTYTISSMQYSTKIATLTGKDVGWPLYASAEGSGFKLRFVTDSSEQFGGFHARFSRVDASMPGKSCPQMYHEAVTAEQHLPSPTSRFEYTAGCSYLINTTDDNAIKLRFDTIARHVKISVHETENYNTERVSQSLADLSVFTSLPHEVVSRTKSLMVMVTLLPKQSGIKVGKGNLFDAVFYRTESPCKCFPNTMSVNSETESSLFSPGYPSEYCDNLNCPVEIKMDYGPQMEGTHKRVRVEINSLQLEHGADFLHFFDRLQHSSRYLMSRTGNSALSRTNYFTFDNEVAELRLITDATVVNRGFNISLIAIQRNNDCKCKGEAQPVEYTTRNGEFSLNVPSSCQFLDCFFHISRPLSATVNDRLRLLVNVSYEFKGAQEEFLELLKGLGNNIIPSHTSDRDVVVYEAGVSKEGVNEISSLEPVRLWYHLASQTADRAANLKFNYEWRPICACGELNLEAVNNEWKQLTSPDYPEFYCNSMKCQYLITAPQDQIVIINITLVSLEPNEDILGIYDGRNITDKRLELATGIQTFNYLIKGTVNEMTVYFESDVSITNKGFVLYYTTEYNPTEDGTIHLHRHSLLYFVLVFLLIVCCGGLFVAYQRSLFCFANRHNWPTTSMVGFSNLTHAANTSTDERSLFP